MGDVIRLGEGIFKQLEALSFEQGNTTSSLESCTTGETGGDES